METLGVISRLGRASREISHALLFGFVGRLASVFAALPRDEPKNRRRGSVNCQTRLLHCTVLLFSWPIVVGPPYGAKTTKESFVRLPEPIDSLEDKNEST